MPKELSGSMLGNRWLIPSFLVRPWLVDFAETTECYFISERPTTLTYNGRIHIKIHIERTYFEGTTLGRCETVKSFSTNM